jgi:uncharacterized membrane protein YkvA (DUF1232 family)
VWWQTAAGIAIALLLLWIALLIALWRLAPNTITLKETARILPDALRLVHRIARDRAVPLRVRLRVWLLIAYLALPIDLLPDFIPVIGYADDAILVIATLRSVIRSTGESTVDRHWPGSAEGLQALRAVLN